MGSPLGFLKAPPKHVLRIVPPPSSLLREALHRNPFPREAHHDSKDTIEAQEPEKEAQDLNLDLQLLSELFPDIQFDVLRELLIKLDGESRLHICVGQLLRHRTEWARGRWQSPPRNIDEYVPLEDSFRAAEYKAATRLLLSREFPYLSKSTVNGVLAENNFCYTRCRPTLAKLSSRTWRATISNLNIFKKRKASSDDPIQLLETSGNADGETLGTGSSELDLELRGLFIRPVVRQRELCQLDRDYKLAEVLNETEAREAAALYDCECCCAEATFEKTSSCTTNGHMICSDCIRRTIHEALFGQGWGRTIDPLRGGLKCLAPLAHGTCDGYISHSIIRKIILNEKSGAEMWAKFEDRLVVDSVLKSSMSLIRCPFCSYAEADPNQCPDGSLSYTWRVRKDQSMTRYLLILSLLQLLPLMLLMVGLLAVCQLSNPYSFIRNSLHTLSLRQRSPRFKCRSPACSRASCLKCQKAWHDPHICHEPLSVSLRTTVEAARTSAIKRTCPRCGLSFVKSSGCNKLTCVCGYTMCYLCRAAIAAPSAAAQHGLGRLRDRDQNLEDYRHFCEHFRINPGRPCTECRKCDLYRSENEDAIVKRAGEMAEREWRIKEGMVGVEGLVEMADQQKQALLKTVLQGGWTGQEVIDWVMGSLIEVDF